VLAIAAKYPNVVALRRPDELSTDTALAIEYVRHALLALERSGDAPYEAIAIVQPSSPFTLPEDVDACVKLLVGAPEADSTVTVMEIDHAIHPAKLKRMEGAKLVPYLEEERGRMAAHELPKLYVRNCSVYVPRRRTIESGSVLGDVSLGLLMPRERSIDINDELDWKFAQFLSQGAA
jgi:CMP-N-acetylneuraminic acid synthetase